MLRGRRKKINKRSCLTSMRWRRQPRQLQWSQGEGGSQWGHREGGRTWRRGGRREGGLGIRRWGWSLWEWWSCRNAWAWAPGWGLGPFALLPVRGSRRRRLQRHPPWASSPWSWVGRIRTRRIVWKGSPFRRTQAPVNCTHPPTMRIKLSKVAGNVQLLLQPPLGYPLAIFFVLHIWVSSNFDES